MERPIKIINISLLGSVAYLAYILDNSGRMILMSIVGVCVGLLLYSMREAFFFDAEKSKKEYDASVIAAREKREKMLSQSINVDYDSALEMASAFVVPDLISESNVEEHEDYWVFSILREYEYMPDDPLRKDVCLVNRHTGEVCLSSIEFTNPVAANKIWNNGKCE